MRNEEAHLEDMVKGFEEMLGVIRLMVSPILVSACLVEGVDGGVERCGWIQAVKTNLA
jgi:hypothetical protein